MLVPLWTVGILAALTPLTPLADRAWRRSPVATASAVVVVLGLAEVARSASSIQAAGLVSAAAVWTGAYLLGFVHRDVVDPHSPCCRPACS